MVAARALQSIRGAASYLRNLDDATKLEMRLAADLEDVARWIEVKSIPSKEIDREL